jgi:putative sterol carrier protein
MRLLISLVSAGALLAATAATAAPVFMSADWAREACTAWNADGGLTQKLHESGWVANHKNRGYKLLRVARGDCPAGAPRAELRIAPKDGKALCLQGGTAGAGALDGDADYLMTADTRRWLEMGRGEYGPMKAMMFGRLSFDGPMGEAMGNMGPFEGFLKLVGSVPGDTSACPQ